MFGIKIIMIKSFGFIEVSQPASRQHMKMVTEFHTHKLPEFKGNFDII